MTPMRSRFIVAIACGALFAVYAYVTVFISPHISDCTARIAPIVIPLRVALVGAWLVGVGALAIRTRHWSWHSFALGWLFGGGLLISPGAIDGAANGRHGSLVSFVQALAPLMTYSLISAGFSAGRPRWWWAATTGFSILIAQLVVRVTSEMPWACIY